MYFNINIKSYTLFLGLIKIVDEEIENERNCKDLDYGLNQVNKSIRDIENSLWPTMLKTNPEGRGPPDCFRVRNE